MTSTTHPVLTREASGNHGAQRLARLAERVGSLRARRTAGDRDERWLLIVGGTAMPLGFVFILLGWYGSAQTVLPFEQIPYLISGGLLGLALVIGGGLLYFAYWLTLQVREARVERERVSAHQERLERVIGELADRLALAAAGPGHTGPAQERVVTTAGGTLLHRPTCRVTFGLEVVEITHEQDTLALCALCQPDAPAPRKAPAPGARRRAAR